MKNTPLELVHFSLKTYIQQILEKSRLVHEEFELSNFLDDLQEIKVFMEKFEGEL